MFFLPTFVFSLNPVNGNSWLKVRCSVYSDRFWSHDLFFRRRENHDSSSLSPRKILVLFHIHLHFEPSVIPRSPRFVFERRVQMVESETVTQHFIVPLHKVRTENECSVNNLTIPPTPNQLIVARKRPKETYQLQSTRDLFSFRDYIHRSEKEWYHELESDRSSAVLPSESQLPWREKLKVNLIQLICSNISIRCIQNLINYLVWKLKALRNCDHEITKNAGFSKHIGTTYTVVTSIRVHTCSPGVLRFAECRIFCALIHVYKHQEQLRDFSKG